MSEFDGLASADDVFKLAAQRTGLSEIDSDAGVGRLPLSLARWP